MADHFEPSRLLVILPKWIGDNIMVTPALRLLRRALPQANIDAIARPGIDSLFAGSNFFDRVHVLKPEGLKGPFQIARVARPHRYDTILLLTGSFSSAAAAVLAGIPRRIGYDRDGRGWLLTHRIKPYRTKTGRYAPVSQTDYFYRVTRAFLPLEMAHGQLPDDHLPGDVFLELATTREEELAADELLSRAKVTPGTPLAMITPGANSLHKAWPPERFAPIADHLAMRHGFTVLATGAPHESELISRVAAACERKPVDLSRLGNTIGGLKAVVRRCSIMVTNDTGPRFIAAAFGVPLVSLLGPTDIRWATIPTYPGAPEAVVLADPTLPPELVANDHRERCAMTRIEVARVVAAVDAMLERTRPRPVVGALIGPDRATP